MGWGKKYRQCKKEENGEVSCISYKPSKEGKKIVTATIKANLSPDCSVDLLDSDGDTNDVADLEEHLSKHVRVKCNKNSPSDL